MSRRDRQRKPPTPGSARAALGYEDFRRMWTSNFLSGIGTWMQNVVLPAYVFSRTGKASMVALFSFSQMGPLLLLSIPAGVIADKFDRRKFLIGTQSVQLLFSILLGILSMYDARITFLFLANLGVGVGNAFNAPAFSAVLPSLVRPEDLGGSIALNSVSVNGSRVIGPIVVVALANMGVNTSGMFFINAATYLFVIFTLVRISLAPHKTPDEKGWRSFTLGIRTARERPVVGRALVTMFSFSLISLTFVGLFPAVAKLTFHIAPKSLTYKWLYATWGFGSMLGALAIGTFLATEDKRKTTRRGFLLFGIALTIFTISPNVPFAFVSGFFLGTTYFSTTTALMTVLQSRLESNIRARVLALWFMAFGGTIPIGNLIFGPIMDRIGSRPILFIGAAWAVFLSWWCDIEKLDRRAAEDAALLAAGVERA